MSIILFHFEQNEIRTGDVDGRPVFCLPDLLLSMESKTDTNKARASVEEVFGDGAVIELPIVDSLGRDQNALFAFESGATFLVSRSRTPKGKRLNRWIHEDVLPSIRKTGSYSVEADREKLEQKFLPTPTIKQIAECSKALKASGVSPLYIERLAIANLKKHYPELLSAAPDPQELQSLLTTKALLTPTDIAVQLGWFCKSNEKSGDARRVNKKLSELGYQEKIGNAWSATQKAIDPNLCDRKPVETGSRTQKDQLLWSVDVLPILQEYAIVA